MKLAAQRRERTGPYLRSREALGFAERQPTLAESLDFIRAGDTERLEKGAQLGGDSGWYNKFAAQAALHLVFDDVGVSKATLESRKRLIDTDRWPYERTLTEGTGDELPEVVSFPDLFNRAYRIFPFTDQLRKNLVKPSDALWKKMVSWAKNSDQTDSARWYSSLLAVDPERFSELDLSEVRINCLQAIDQQRMKRPVTKDASQADLLNMLARTRLMFPDMLGPNSLRPEERRATRSHLQRSREVVSWGTGFTSFPDYFYNLALLETPHLTVDSQGIHLSVQPGPMQPLVGLPERSEIG